MSLWDEVKALEVGQEVLVPYPDDPQFFRHGTISAKDDEAKTIELTSAFYGKVVLDYTKEPAPAPDAAEKG